MKLTKYLIAAIAVLTVCSVRADEGMWLLQLMKQQNSTDMMKKQGLKLEADDLYNPNGVSLKDAVGIFGGPIQESSRALFDLDNVIMTPHMAATTEQSVLNCCTSVANDIVAVCNGQEPQVKAQKPKF